MQRRILTVGLLFFILTLPALAAPGAKATRAARSLAERIVPQVADRFRFALIGDSAGHDVFEIEMEHDRVAVRGNSANAMAVGLNHYLKYYCRTSVSWYADDPVELPAELPRVPGKVRRTSRAEHRFFLNYCTFGYTMPWWQWRDWERLIDWMALNGVNMPLAITGQESVWLRVWTRLGLPADTVRAYFTGPAHLPWHRMTNFDHFQGPLPDSYLNHQEQLQKQIVARERELGMTPVLPAFAGHVPEALVRFYPKAKITRMSSWGGFRDDYRSYFLDPLDSLFGVIQHAFLEEQTRLYGTDHIYGADPFNEIESPSWEPDYLATVARTIYGTMREVDPEAQWLQMTWLFYFDSRHWTGPRIDAFVNGVPRGKMILLDYFAENVELWKRTEGYYGQPYLWCYLGNFGGNTMLAGNFRETGRRIENVLRHGRDNCWGIGSTLESFDTNPFMYEYVFEKAWSQPLPDDEWLRALADRRLGRADAAYRDAWARLADTVYTRHAELGQGALTNARPGLTGNGNWTTNPYISYDNRVLYAIWRQMAEVEPSPRRDTYIYDVVNLGRQVLSNYFPALRDSFARACERRDLKAMQAAAARMTELLDDLERLLSCHRAFSMYRWIEDAAAFGTDETEKDYYRRNARTLVTTWGERGQSLNDYANRSWAGLTAGYYARRWRMFADEACRAVGQGKDFDEQAFRERVLDFEADWADHGTLPPAQPAADGVEVARQLIRKYAVIGHP